jgi:hypothetical protein
VSSVKDIVRLIFIEKNITRLMPRGTTLGKDATPLIQIQSPSGVLDKVDLDLPVPRCHAKGWTRSLTEK